MAELSPENLTPLNALEPSDPILTDYLRIDIEHHATVVEAFVLDNLANLKLRLVYRHEAHRVCVTLSRIS